MSQYHITVSMFQNSFLFVHFKTRLCPIFVDSAFEIRQIFGEDILEISSNILYNRHLSYYLTPKKFPFSFECSSMSYEVACKALKQDYAQFLSTWHLKFVKFLEWTFLKLVQIFYTIDICPTI